MLERFAYMVFSGVGFLAVVGIALLAVRVILWAVTSAWGW